MKRMVFLFSLIAVLITVNAQQTKPKTNKFFFAGGINLGLPIGDFSDTRSVGIGIELQPEYNVNGKAAMYGSVGYTEFFGKKFDFEDAENLSSGLIPVLIGGKVYISPQFFIGAKAGLGILTGWGSGVGFDYQPQFGFNGRNYQVNFGYNGLSSEGVTLSSLSLSVLYKF
jgi:hypothetical protein